MTTICVLIVLKASRKMHERRKERQTKALMAEVASLRLRVAATPARALPSEVEQLRRENKELKKKLQNAENEKTKLKAQMKTAEKTLQDATATLLAHMASEPARKRTRKS